MSNISEKNAALRLALRANAWFSVVFGAALFLAARPVADVVGLTPALGAAAALALVFGTGVILLIGGAGLFAISRRPIIDHWLAGFATGANALWVVGTMLLFVIAGPPFPGTGRWLLAGVAPIFAVIAAAQAYGLWRDRPLAPARRLPMVIQRGHAR